MIKTGKGHKLRQYVVSSLLDKDETDPAQGLLGHSEAYQRMVVLRDNIAKLQSEMEGLIASISKTLENEWMVGAAKAFAKKKHLRAANGFALSEDGTLLLLCNGIERKVTKSYTHKVETMAELRQRGKELGIDVDALGLGVQRRKIAAHLDEAVAQRNRTAKATVKMFRTGDAVSVAI